MKVKVTTVDGKTFVVSLYRDTLDCDLEDILDTGEEVRIQQVAE